MEATYLKKKKYEKKMMQQRRKEIRGREILKKKIISFKKLLQGK